VKDPKGGYWHIENNIRHPLPDKTFVNLYFKQRTARAWTQKQLDAVPLGEPYQLQEGELVRSKEETTVYVIEAGGRRPFTSGADLEELGYAWKNVIVLPKKLLANYPLGEAIDPHPSEALPLLVTTSPNQGSASSTVSAAGRLSL
jgi:hypothetical protein